jgi:uncharacterized membrane protein YphA (DoxX/SURF4 family)
MNYFIKTGRVFYSLALIVYGIQHFYFGTFRNVFFSPYQDLLPLQHVFAWLFGLYLVVSGVLIRAGKNGKKVALLSGAIFFMLFLTTQLTYELISEPNKIYHLGLWVNPLKEIALTGGALVVAGSFAEDNITKGFYRFLNKLIPYGNLFFLFTMTAFGIGHLMAGARLGYIVPAWWPDHEFWVYFTGAALVAAGVAIILGIRIRVVSLLLALMIFLWVWMVHIPAGIARPVFNRGDLLASAFDALAFSGFALIMAFTLRSQQWVDDIEKWHATPEIQ